MARFLVGTIPAIGHVNPAIPIVRKLVERGHEVWWYTGKNFQAKVAATGARHIPIRSGLDFSDLENLPQDLLQKREALEGINKFKFDLKNFFIDSALAQFKDYTEILKEFPADVLLSDLCFLGASWVYEKGGPPWAIIGIGPLAFTSSHTAPFGLGITPEKSPKAYLRNIFLHWVSNRILLNDVSVYLDDMRGKVGLSRNFKSFFDSIISPFLHLQGTVPSFEYPHRDLPKTVHFIGPFLPEAPTDFTPPVWWDELKSGKPVIHVTQGTIATQVNDLIVPTLRGLADENVLVIATTGGEAIESIKLEPMPENVRIETFIPHYHLLPYVDVMVTNGGYNGVQVALANGVPLVVAGTSEDKPEVCARIAWAGVGINLKTKTPTPMEVKEAVKTILTSPDYRQKAEKIKDEIASYDAPTQSAILLEELAATKEPILRVNI